MSTRGTWVVGIGLGLAACAIPEPDEVNAVAQAIVADCGDPKFCMYNSPQIATYSMFDFNLDGLENAAGFSIIGLIKNNYSYDLLVRDSRIVGQIHGVDYLRDQDLIGAEIVLQSKVVGQVAIVIQDVGEIRETVSVKGVHNSLQTYVLDWGEVIGRPLQKPVPGGQPTETPIVKIVEPLCHVDLTNWTSSFASANPVEWDDAFVAFGSGHSVYQSLVFEGDRIDPVTRTIDPKPDDRWFNVGCDAHTLAKMRLSRNTIHTGGWATAQAALKMFSADYCGKGKAFTVDGEPLVWRARSGMTFYSSPKEIEARWNEYGALCLTEPRLLDTSVPAALAEFPDIWTAIKNECTPPPICDAGLPPDKDEFSDELITTANY